jgi:glycerophosphoryl diester phosphodiesterase
LKTAIELGAAGSEIDIQRTKDGYYVVNHDNGFGRVAGVKANVNDLTLEQIRELTVLDSGEPIPTLEEMLTAARDKITLFVELKGATADTQMCDDAVKLVRDMGMADQVVFISLKYNLIDYLETSYPDMLTGYLTFLSYGSTAKLNCDYIGLEEESAAADAINSVHNQGKKVMVWTVNDKESQEHFLATAADAIITDNIIQANETVISLKNRNDLERIASVIRQI